MELTTHDWRVKLKIETSPDGEEVLKVTVPAGKSWTVQLVVDITETDV